VRKLVCACFSGAVCLDLEVRSPYERHRDTGVQAAQARRRRMRSHVRDGARQVLAAVAQMSSYGAPLARLTPGSGGSRRRQVIEIQRARILAAAVDTVEESGYAAMTVATVIQRARISRKTFYEVFANRNVVSRRSLSRSLPAPTQSRALPTPQRAAGLRQPVRPSIACCASSTRSRGSRGSGLSMRRPDRRRCTSARQK
jgi:hypothetical protein